VIAACVLSAAGMPAQTRTTQQTQLSTEVGEFPLYVTVEYLGMAGVKTVCRIRLRAPELSMAAAKRGLKALSGELAGSFTKGENVTQAFKYNVSGDVSDRQTFTYAFLRAVEPGEYVLKLTLSAPGGKKVAEASTEVSVPEVGNAFSPDLAPGETSTLPAAEAIVIADTAGDTGETVPGAGSKLKILPPNRETPIGILRLDAVAEPPITKVEFYLEDKLILSRSKPPYTVEIDLGELPRKQTIRAVGYDLSGRLVDEDAWAINQGSSRLAVKILPHPDPATNKVRIKVVVQSIAGGTPKQVELYLNDKKLKAWATEPPYEVTIPMAEYSRGEYLRATAIGDDGKEANDIRFLKGPNTTIESVRVDVVQLHVSAVDKSNHFVTGLTEKDFSIQEDGRSQAVTGFEVAEKLPLTIGLVVDGSGSMEKAMPFVHEACAALFRGIMRDKDRGFVIEFREQPRMLQNLTGDKAELQRAAREPSARGATALFDSVVLGLYQFRALQGRKALVVVTDGADNRSHVDYETLLRYARTAGAPIYFIAVNISIVDFGIRSQLNEIAKESGGEVFHISNPDKVQDVVLRIEEELRSQYIVAFRTDSQKPDGEYRAVTVAVGKPGVTARTIKGYIP
jgi:VWFA-related protein